MDSLGKVQHSDAGYMKLALNQVTSLACTTTLRLVRRNRRQTGYLSLLSFPSTLTTLLAPIRCDQQMCVVLSGILYSACVQRFTREMVSAASVTAAY